MHRRAKRTNRVMLALVGLLLLAAGAFIIGHGEGWWPGLDAGDKLYTASEARWLHHNSTIWIGVAAVAIIIGLIAVRWLLAQTRIDRVRSVRIEDDDSQRGRTRLPADAVTDAIEDDVVEYPGVARARAALTGAVDAPELVLRVFARPRSDIAEIYRHILAEALPAARTALEPLQVDVQVHLFVSGRKDADRLVL